MIKYWKANQKPTRVLHSHTLHEGLSSYIMLIRPIWKAQGIQDSQGKNSGNPSHRGTQIQVPDSSQQTGEEMHMDMS